MSNIEIKNVSKRFDRKQALDSVSFEIGEGQICGFVGANGAGKTTTMRIIMGVLASDSGSVSFDGRPITDQDRGTIGYMPSERGLYPKMKVGKQLIYLARLHGLSKAEAEAETDKWLKMLNVDIYKDALLKTLSTGNAQRVQLASALVIKPKFLILDEPFSGLDPIAVESMSSTIKHMAAEGVSILFSSHQLELIDELCDKVIIIKDGQIVQDGSPASLRESAGAPPTIEVPTPLSTIFKELVS